MNISLVASPAGSLPSAPQNGSRQQAQHLNAIANALQVGDFSGAQKAFAAFQQYSQANENAATAPVGPANPASKSAQALATALKADDWAGSTQAFRALRQEVQNARKPIQARAQNDGQDGDNGEESVSDSTEAQAATTIPQVGSRLDVKA
jgi:hypothetical protein